jgi:hypothetical protein
MSDVEKSADDQKLSLTETSAICGITPALVRVRTDSGDLPFRYVGNDRRVRMQDALELKARLDARQEVADALAAATEDLIVKHGL